MAKRIVDCYRGGKLRASYFVTRPGFLGDQSTAAVDTDFIAETKRLLMRDGVPPTVVAEADFQVRRP